LRHDLPSRNAIVRINAVDQSQETIAVHPPMSPGVPGAWLDAPLSLTFGTGKGERQNLLITDSGMMGGFFPGSWPGRGLVKIDVGIPGLPSP
jgi:hypothetical protein